ncbi:MAG: hypothetical protein OEY74_04730 [Gammaproteobacteria bacterium]|nr:hypothetical protein [Gammaproteobacteria bacterium]
MFNHALAKGALFIAVACLAMCVGTVTLDGLAGAGRRQPVAMVPLDLAERAAIALLN